jgi:hypothetical protein
VPGDGDGGGVAVGTLLVGGGHAAVGLRIPPQPTVPVSHQQR